jgi:molybdenum cofactor cytidylyltransferase
LLAHRLKPEGGPGYPKGHRLSSADVEALRRCGVQSVIAVRLDADDVHEDAAAARLIGPLLGTGVAGGAARTGRINVFARHRGLLSVDRGAVDRFNRIHESMTLATASPGRPVEPKQMVATLKIIPFAVPEAIVASGEAPAPVLAVHPFRPLTARLVLTTLPHTVDKQLERAERVQAARLGFLGGRVDRAVRVPHRTDAVAPVLTQAVADGVDVVLMLGASAICDRRDVLPAAVEIAGGEVEHFGMPVDPGNLVMLGAVDGVPTLGLPGCAKSAKPSGFDWILWRLAAGQSVTGADVMGMGVGGLLTEVEQRPAPRAAPAPARPRVAAVILAAGRSSRMGAGNKLLMDVKGQPMIRHPVEVATAAGLEPVVVVTGHQAPAVEAALSDADVEFAHNAHHAEGMSTSLRAGIRALPEDVDGAMVFLGDMPFVTADHVRTLLEGFNPHGPGAIRVPVRGRKRGHPVLWSRTHFGELEQVEGDEGARGVLDRHPDEVQVVDVPDDGIHLDIDTPEAWAQLVD